MRCASEGCAILLEAITLNVWTVQSGLHLMRAFPTPLPSSQSVQVTPKSLSEPDPYHRSAHVYTEAMSSPPPTMGYYTLQIKLLKSLTLLLVVRWG